MHTNESHEYNIYLSPYSNAEEWSLTVILLITVMVSLYGNMGMLYVLYKNDKMWNSTNILIGNLAFTGVCVTLVCMPFNLTSVIFGRWPYQNGPICKFNGFGNSVLLLITILTHTLISLDKYFGVVKPFSRAMTITRTWKMLIIVWLISIVLSLGPLAKFGNFEYNHTTLVCGVGFPKNKRDSLYLFVLATVGFLLPGIAMVHIYIKIFFAVKNHSRRLRSNSVTSQDVINLQKRLIFTGFFSLLCFLLCWAPFFCFIITAIIIDSPNDLPHGLGVAAYVCGYLYNVTNPFIICRMSPRFGDGLMELTKNIFACIFLCCGRIKSYRKTLNKSQNELEPLPPAPPVCTEWKLRISTDSMSRDERASKSVSFYDQTSFSVT